MVKVACAYGIPSIRIDRASQLAQIDLALAPVASVNRCCTRSEPGVRAALTAGSYPMADRFA